eukprot:TRINITY_DN1402_c0_g2_i1.p1 TRINITY_DN1402_c0_g2~~TRINITY_DN1402_c0_g2_i1.p1  ORF type:complete len:727 (-),score=163.35 TRINITY_DN1402_c0_g2_i1:409-2589(-)
MASLDDKKDNVDFAFLNGTLSDLDVINSKENVNPIVYRLVRIQKDGTLVPATEEEIAHLLDDEKFNKSSNAQRKHENSQNSPSIDSFIEDEDVTGLSEPEDVKEERRKQVAKVEFIGAMLQRVNEEERMKLNSGIQGSSRYRFRKNITNKTDFNYSQTSPDTMSHLILADAHSRESPSPVTSGLIDEQTVLEMERNSDMSSSPGPDDMVKPDHITTKRDVCLDNLSIRELHEEFRRTFGRETSAKDKQWLKRRISMGLHNTTDASNDVLIENKNPSVQKQDKDYTSGNESPNQFVNSLTIIQPIRRRMPTNVVPQSYGFKQTFGNIGAMVPIKEIENSGQELDEEFTNHNKRAGKKLRKPKVEYACNAGTSTRIACKKFRDIESNYDHDKVCNQEKVAVKKVRNPHADYAEYYETVYPEKVAQKRVRKPTRRYIEELSEEESKTFGARTSVEFRDFGNNPSSTKSHSDPPYANGVNGMALISKPDFLGVSEFQSPFVPKMRRGRPRKNYTFSLEKNPDSYGMSGKLAKKTMSVQAPQYDEYAADRKRERSDPSETFEPTVNDFILPDENTLVAITAEGSISDPLEYDVEEDNSDDYVATVPTAKGGTRRKHHRAWTLGEVMKLVEGVSKCGAGRWSEIKRLAFSAHGHRTSVDLKDKWRNLLRASYAQLHPNKEGKAQRKHASIPIPSSILAQVRELAAMQSQALGSINPSSMSRSGRTVHRKQPM